MSRQIPIKAGDRWITFGASGTGKTTFNLELISRLWSRYRVPLYILNSKPDSKVSSLGRTVETERPPRPLRRPGMVIWHNPDHDRNAYDDFFKAIHLTREPLIVYVDESAYLGGRTGDTYPLWLLRMIRNARDLRQTVILSSQRVSKAPPEFYTEASHVVAFQLRSKYDRLTLARDALMLDDLDIQHPHGFYHARVDRIEPAAYYTDAGTFFAGPLERPHS